MSRSLEEREALTPVSPAREGRQEYLRLLEVTSPAVHRFTGERITDRGDAADVAQQTLMIAVLKLDTFRGGNFHAWLFTIARHLIIDYHRAHSRYQFLELEKAAQAEVEPALRTGPETVSLACECRERVRSWLDCLTVHLPLEEQVAVLLADVYGHRDKESAALLGISLPSFKLMLHVARGHLNRIAGGACQLVENQQRECGVPVLRSTTAEGGRSAECGVVEKGRGQRAENSMRNAECGVEEQRARRKKNGENGQGGRNSDPVNCGLGLKCCRQVSKLLSLRGRLLEGLNVFLCSLVLIRLEQDGGLGSAVIENAGAFATKWGGL